MIAKLLTAIVLSVLLASCAHDRPFEPSVPFGGQVTLAPGETASVEGAPVRVTFLRVSGDSRCPAGVYCILGGDALVHIRIEDGATGAEYELHTGDSSRAAASHAGVRVALLKLEPYPFSSRTIGADEYRATLEISR